MSQWLAQLPTTNTRILVSLVLALATGARVVATGWEPPLSWLGFLLAMMGLDVAQFTAKRLTWRGNAER
ncbi:MAG: hypothetical protein KatS3mg109_1978 [Pirellulaceae bacterium]|nr:MAG: hypothetical protein KatS3mg109_0379 [Pirellulaceae bacterium]GIW91546.1 MAG: hypothetical protein KatS3mg109_1978 [Pirellulaceae bacterium]